MKDGDENADNYYNSHKLQREINEYNIHDSGNDLALPLPAAINNTQKVVSQKQLELEDNIQRTNDLLVRAS